MLPGLPLELWSAQGFKLIGDKLGKFLYFDEQSLKKENKKIVVLLVEVDISKGLLFEIEIVRGNHSFSQRVDYWDLPFRCRRCCQVGHLQKNCSLEASFRSFQSKAKPLFPFSDFDFEGPSIHSRTELVSIVKKGAEKDVFINNSVQSLNSKDSFNSSFSSVSFKVA